MLFIGVYSPYIEYTYGTSRKGGIPPSFLQVGLGLIFPSFAFLFGLHRLLCRLIALYPLAYIVAGGYLTPSCGVERAHVRVRVGIKRAFIFSLMVYVVVSSLIVFVSSRILLIRARVVPVTATTRTVKA
jgi:hypothetical protein